MYENILRGETHVFQSRMNELMVVFNSVELSLSVLIRKSLKWEINLIFG